MDELATALINLFDFFASGLKNMVRTSLYFGLGGCLIFIWCFLIYWKHLGREATSISGKFWAKFTLKEACYVVAAMLNNFVAIFLLSYSLITAGTLLLSTAKRTSSNIDKILGQFLSKILPILGIAALLVIIGFGNDLYWECIAVGAAFGIILLRGIKYTQ